MKSEVLIAMQVQLRYIGKVLLDGHNFEKAINHRLIGNDRSPAEVFMHCISTLFKHSYAGVPEKEPETV